MTNETTFITEFELKEDLVESVAKNPDINFTSNELETQVNKFPIGTLLEVDKKIGSDTIILSVKEVNEELLASAFK